MITNGFRAEDTEPHRVKSVISSGGVEVKTISNYLLIIIIITTVYSFLCLENLSADLFLFISHFLTLHTRGTDRLSDTFTILSLHLLLEPV